MQIEHIIKNGKSGVKCFPWGGGKPFEDFSMAPYFYVPDEKGGVWNKNPKFWAVDGIPVKKVQCRMASDVADRRGDYHYDAKIQYTSRYWIDKIKEVKEGNPIKMYMDIEAGSNGGVLNQAAIDSAKDPIIIIGIWDSISRKVIQFCHHSNLDSFKTKRQELRVSPSEVAMFKDFINYFTEVRPEVFLGFNSQGGFEMGTRRATGYDNPYMINRANRIGVDLSPMSPLHQVRVNHWGEAKFAGIAPFDLLGGYLHLERRSYDENTLDAVLKRDMKTAKYTRPGFDAAHLMDAWIRDPDEVLEYNFWDVKHMVDWDQTKGISDAHIEFHRIFGCNLADTLYAGRSLEHYIRREMPEFIFPSFTRPTNGELKGAAPRDPKVGLHEDILFVDLTSAYPMAMMSGNMSYETILKEEEPDCINVNGVFFRQHEHGKGKFVQVIEELFQKKSDYGKLREQYIYKSPEWKVMDNRRNAYKVGINTVYGHTGYERSPFFNLPIANSVTFMTRGVINAVESEIVNMGYERIFGHTDSVGFRTGAESLDEQIDIGHEVVKHLNDFFPQHLRAYNIKREHARMEVDFEKIAKRGVFAKKTRYALKLAWADGKVMEDKGDGSDVEIKGFDAIKSDSSRLARQLQKELIQDILNGFTLPAIRKKYSVALKDIETGKYPLMEIATPSTLNKELKNYETNYPRRVACEWSNTFLNTAFEGGTKPFVLDAHVQKGMLGAKVNQMTIPLTDTKYVAIGKGVELPPWVVVDYPTIANKVRKKLDYILEPAGWSVKNLEGQKTFADFLCPAGEE